MHPDYATNVLRVKNRVQLLGILTSVFRTRTTQDWIDALKAADVPVSPVNRLEEVLLEPQVVHNEMLLDLVHPRHGVIRTVANAVHLERTPARPFGYPPDIGEHTREVLEEFGFGSAETADLFSREIVR